MSQWRNRAAGPLGRSYEKYYRPTPGAATERPDALGQIAVVLLEPKDLSRTEAEELWAELQSEIKRAGSYDPNPSRVLSMLASVESHPLGRRFWEELKTRPDLADAHLVPIIGGSGIEADIAEEAWRRFNELRRRHSAWLLRLAVLSFRPLYSERAIEILDDRFERFPLATVAAIGDVFIHELGVHANSFHRQPGPISAELLRAAPSVWIETPPGAEGAVRYDDLTDLGLLLAAMFHYNPMEQIMAAAAIKRRDHFDADALRLACCLRPTEFGEPKA